MIHSRGGAGAELGDVPAPPAVPSPTVVPQNGTRIRQDGWAPVLTFQTETDLVAPIGYLPARQDDTELFRLWEVAGTAHADAYAVRLAREDDGSWGADLDGLAELRRPSPVVNASPTFSFTCGAPINAGQQHYVFQAAWQALIDWARTGRAPQSRPRLDINTAVTPPVYRLDAVGNVLGGIRTPAVDAPLAVLSGVAPAGGSPFCVLFGQTRPLTPIQLHALYPTQRDFQQAWVRATRDAERAGNLLREDADSLRAVVGG
jgi:hypothetical protein